MKYFPSNILIEIGKKTKNIDPVLFYGNEGGLIAGLIKSTYSVLQKKLELSEIIYFDHKKESNDKFEKILISSSLFSKINFIVIKNPQEELTTQLKNIKKIENILIINGENLRSKSNLKSYFENHQKFISVPCYKLEKKHINKIVNDFIRKNNIIVQNEAYDFLIDNINEDYLILQNELQKLSIYKNSSINLKNLQNLIVQKNNFNADNIFFNCAAGDSTRILKEMNSSNRSINESYDILSSLKKFINLLLSATINKDSSNIDDLVKSYLPKYLFLKKEIFREILKKTNLNKVIKINILLQKTEYLLRKNSKQHREILERFLLNLAKIMK